MKIFLQIVVGPKNLFSFYLQLSHGGKDFPSSYITSDIFSNSTFFGSVEEADEK